MSGVRESGQSEAFGLLDPRVQRWIWQQRWTDLRDAQERAARPILEGDRDVLIAAATASGKTEAAFLPIVSSLLTTSGRGVAALYVAPLRALINDQYDRLSGLCESLEIPVHKWHGDVGDAPKQRVMKNPSGILLITPESLEALFVRRGTAIAGTFACLKYAVIDEVHAFIGEERGRQVQSLLDRLEVVLDRPVPRVGLSATIGDLSLAAAWLRPSDPERVLVIEGDDGGQEIKLLVRGYEIRPPKVGSEPLPIQETEKRPAEAEEPTEGSILEIADQLFGTTHLGHHLIFANSRNQVETYADLLRRWCEKEVLPISYFPHHGNLSKEIREEAESRLKDDSRPASAVCTVTLELGIDVGNVETIAQVGAPTSVSGLRQRLGRSGRRGQAAVLRIYVQEPELRSDLPLHATLRSQLVQSVAIVQLMLKGWCEPPLVGALHLSTLVQQLLSLVAQYGGVSPSDAWAILCVRGPFKGMTPSLFGLFLHSLGDEDLLTQMPDGTLLLGQKAERIVEHYQFYAAFATPDEFSIVAGGKTLGTLPIDDPLAEGSYLIFAGRRWRVEALDLDRRLISVVPAPGGRVPVFGGGGGLVHDAVRQEMRSIYIGGQIPTFLDQAATGLLREGRGSFARAELVSNRIVQSGTSTLLFPWVGDRALNTLAVALSSVGYGATKEGVAVNVLNSRAEDVADTLADMAEAGPLEATALASTVAYKQSAKWDWALSETLMNEEYGHRDLDVEGAWRAASFVVSRHRPPP